jgi:hypothetical protein
LAIRLCAASDIDTRTRVFPLVLWVHSMAWLRRYPIHLGQTTRGESGADWGYSSQLRPVWQANGLVSGGNTHVAVLAWPASPALDVKLCAA